MGTWYTNEAAFLAAVNNEQSDTFSDLNGFYSFPVDRLDIGDGRQYVIAGLGGLYVEDVDGIRTASTNDAGVLLTCTVQNDDNCIGGIFNLSNVSFIKESGNVLFTISNGDTYNFTIGTADSFFIGYIGDNTDQNLEIIGNPDDANQYLGAEKIYIGNVFTEQPSIDATPIESEQNFGLNIEIISDLNSEINVTSINSIEDFGSNTNLFSYLELEIQTSILSEEDLANILIYSNNYIDPSPIEPTEDLTLAYIDLYIDPNDIDSNEDFGQDTNLLPENFIEPITVESEENLLIEKTQSDAFIYPVSIGSQELSDKQIIFPKPFPGTIQTWYEELHTIETELYLRKRS